MEFIKGIYLNLKGLHLAINDRRLLFWGMLRFFLLAALTLVLAITFLEFSVAVTESIWSRPENPFAIWFWKVLLWIMRGVLVGLSIILSYLISQLTFSLLIMDHMSRIVEERMTGALQISDKPKTALFLHLLKEEIPRAVIPILFSLSMLVLGWLLFLGPLFSVISSLIACIFIAWDNTDLVPARRLIPFKVRFRMLLREIPFHVGFGIPFLVPFLNVLLIAFAPVGGTLYYLEKTGTKISYRSSFAPRP